MADQVEQSFSVEEIDAIKQIQTGYANNTAQIGQVEVELFLVNKRLDELQQIRTQLFTTYESLQQQERELVDALNTKYGDGVVDLDSGKFIPSTQ